MCPTSCRDATLSGRYTYNNNVDNKFLKKKGTLTSATLYFTSGERLTHTHPFTDIVIVQIFYIDETIP